MTSQAVEAYPRQSARRWLPFAVVVGLFVAANVAVGVVGALAPEPHGHWTGHLSAATIDIGMIVVVVVGAALAWRYLGGAVVKLLAGAALATVLVGLVNEAVGNLRVARSIWRTVWGDDEVGQFGPAFSGFDSGHDLAASGDLVVVLGGVAFALVLGFSRRVGVLAAGAGVIFSFIPPPFIIPACGVVFVLAALVRPRKERSGSSSGGKADLPVATSPRRRVGHDGAGW